MAALARSNSPTRDDLDSDFGVGEFAFAPGDVLGTRPTYRRSRWGKRLLLFGLLAGGGALHGYDPAVLPVLATAGAQLIVAALRTPDAQPASDLPRLSLIDPRAIHAAPATTSPSSPGQSPVIEPGAVAAPPPAARRPLEEAGKSQAPVEPKAAAAPANQVAPVTTGALAAPSSSTEPAQASPPPAYVDPLHKRAERIGLHPDLSSAILRGLSDADFRNAEAAIRRALAETDDGSVFLSPKPERDTLARFKVHFVVGAETGCRRYVVTIIKRGWEATALPMERCGVKRTAGTAQKARP